MFSARDASVFDQPDSYGKLDSLGDTYFRQLGGLLKKAEELVNDIYGIRLFENYKTTEVPTSSKQRRKDAEFKANRNNVSQVIVGLRGKGKPIDLTKPNGTACKMHFARLGFGIVESDGSIDLAVGFEPYTLKYHRRHRDNLAHWVDYLSLSNLFSDIPVFYSHDAKSISDLLRIHGAILRSELCPAIDPTLADLAQLVITYAALFPFLDVFTRLSNGENVEGSDYTGRFFGWKAAKQGEYINSFEVMPVQYQSGRVSEAQIRHFFETLLEHEFPTARPSWLRPNRQDAPLELDGYCDELRLAFEYQGEYHFIPVEIHHRGRSLEDVQRNDELKRRLCRKNGVDLIEVPYFQKDNPDFVITTLKGLKRPDLDAILAKSKNLST